jgi:hypothetical protein
VNVKYSKHRYSQSGNDKYALRFRRERELQEKRKKKNLNQNYIADSLNLKIPKTPIEKVTKTLTQEVKMLNVKELES